MRHPGRNDGRTPAKRARGDRRMLIDRRRRAEAGRQGAHPGDRRVNSLSGRDFADS